MQSLIKDRDFSPELKYTFLRSRGPGGQHVNKVNTQAQLTFSVRDSKILNPDEKKLLLLRLDNRLTDQGVLQIRCQIHRSQLANKRCAYQKFIELIYQNTRPKKKRVPTKVSQAARERRLHTKKHRKTLKAGRAKLNPRDFL